MRPRLISGWEREMTRLAFDPHLPLALIGALAVIAILITAGSFLSARAGAWARGLAFGHSSFRAGGPVW